MNYDRIILELLERVKVLEEQIELLLSRQEQPKDECVSKVTTNNIKNYINEQKRLAKEHGKTELILKSGDVHKELGLSQRHPQVCNAMRSCMSEEDSILYQPPKGNGTTLQILYRL